MKLSTWIEKNGGRVKTARQLGVTKEALHYWMARRCTPRANTILKIVRLSQGQVTIGNIITETRAKKRGKK